MEKGAMQAAICLALAVLLAGGVGLSEATVYKVGDSVGWTILGSPNYTAWASNKNFLVGDTVVFVYNKQFHNVMEVTKENFQGCNASSSVAAYKTGNDAITLDHTGHYYFLCGTPGHCAAGQKVDIEVTKSSSAASSSAPSGAPSAAPSTVPSAAPSSAPTASPSTIGGAVSGPSSTSTAPSPAANAAATAVPNVIVFLVELFSFAALSSGLVMHW